VLPRNASPETAQAARIQDAGAGLRPLRETSNHWVPEDF
jgi:hypothetical protein